MNFYRHGVHEALVKLGMLMRPQQQQQPQKSGGGIGGMAKSMLSGGLIGTGGLLSGGMGIPGTGGINPMMGKKPGGGQRMDPTGMQGFPNPAGTGGAWGPKNLPKVTPQQEQEMMSGLQKEMGPMTPQQEFMMRPGADMLA